MHDGIPFISIPSHCRISNCFKGNLHNTSGNIILAGIREIMKHEYILPLLTHAATDTSLGAFHNQWILASLLVKVLHAHYDIANFMKFSSLELINAISPRHKRLLLQHNLRNIEVLDVTLNSSGIFMVRHKNDYLFYLRNTSKATRTTRSNKRSRISEMPVCRSKEYAVPPPR